ncbi:AEC family transporter [Pantoea cypripedii]|uniref:AEC family transporter n=1 Tax=Pantoea cypripedii TaxID=55209 RepID=A0A6B9G6H2_PANCY|nr:AEC family transporter [Pantoea cypripedii]QGY33184.1 AEC family transporter [Pantoea cypripedii]
MINLTSVVHQLSVSVPVFSLIAVGFFFRKIDIFPLEYSKSLTGFVFNLALPVLMFRMMYSASGQNHIEYGLLVAFFGSCFIVFMLGKWIATRVYGHDTVSSSVFALGGIFSNNAFLGIPVAKSLLGDVALPYVATILIFNGLILWTLVTVSIEWGKQGVGSLKGLGKVVLNVFRNPLIIGIFAGFAISVLNITIPPIVDEPIQLIGSACIPVSLVALGINLASYRFNEGLKESSLICFLKLIIQPLVIWALAISIGLPALEAKVAVLMGSLAVGLNVYLMSEQFDALKAATASGMLVSTVGSAFTTPILIVILDSYYR